MITQYTDSYGNIGAEIQNIVANNIKALDSYVLMQTGQYEYTALIYNNASKKCEKLTFTRNTQQGYNNTYTVKRTVDEFEYKITNEYYVYSNIGHGRYLDLSNLYTGITAHATAVIMIVICFAIVFKGALFKCIDGLRKRRL